MKFSVCTLCAAMLLSGCSMSNTAKGGLIGGGGGGALGALIGSLAGGGKGAAIGTAIGATLGAGAGVIIGNKMDKAKKAAEAASAQAEILTDKDGVEYVKATFSSGLLFNTGSSALSTAAITDINTFITNLKAEDSTYDLYVYGYTDNEGWKNSTAEESKRKNLTLSQQRAQAVSNQITAAGYPVSRLVSVTGYGEDNPVADNSTADGKNKNRRVEIYILPSTTMVNAANAAAQ